MSINWKEIKEKYPKAYQLYDAYYTISAMSDIYGDHHPHQRSLYDFFDEQFIFVTVDALSTDFNGKNVFVDKWSCQILSNDWGEINTNYESRIKAEERAFIEAFSVLEERLK